LKLRDKKETWNLSHFASLIQDENDLCGVLEKFQHLQVSSLFAKALVGFCE
jgi:hypothetical protein